MDKLTKRDKNYLLQAKLKGYLEVNNSCGQGLRNVFFDFCRDNNIPRLILIKTRYYSSIDLDFIADYDATDKEIEIFKEIYKRYSHSKSEYSFSEGYIFMKKIKLEDYDEFKSMILKTMKKIITSKGIKNNFFKE